MRQSRGMTFSPCDWCGRLWLVLYSFSHCALKAVMSGGNDGSGDGGGVRDDDGAHGAGPQEPQSLGFQAGQTPALSPGSAVQRALGVAAGGGTELVEGFWMEKGPHGLWPSGVYCGYIAKDAGGGRSLGLDVASGTHPDLRELRRCHCGAPSAEEGGSRDI